MRVDGELQVIWIVIDGLPARHVSPALTPNLWQLATDDHGSGPLAGRSVLTSATYANHATFATGVTPRRHGIVANWIPTSDGIRPAAGVGPATTTIFEALRAAGRSSVAVVGDQHLVGVMGLAATDAHWPQDGAVPAGVAVDEYGYASDPEVVTAAALIDAHPDADLTFVHLNESDTHGHLHGPDHVEALDGYRRADAALGQVLDFVRSRWSRMMVVVQSDHDMESVHDRAPIDVVALSRATGLACVPEGSGCVLVAQPDRPVDLDPLRAWSGIEGHAWLGEVHGSAIGMAWSEVGRAFGHPDHPIPKGTHGGLRTTRQALVVGGGHPMAQVLAADARHFRSVPASTVTHLVSMALGVATDWIGSRRRLGPDSDQFAPRSAPRARAENTGGGHD